jgi:hypothetical protein
MNLGNIDIGCRGSQNLQVLKKGELVKETGFHKNMVLNSFFTGITADNFSLGGQLAVGTGSTPPAPEQINLAGFLAGRGFLDFGAERTLHATDATHFTYRHRRTWTFPEGGVVGNVSETATSFRSGGSAPTASTTMHTRALVLDQASQPTTITVAADEQLRVIHDLFVKVPKAATVLNFSVTTGGNTTNHTATMQFTAGNSATGFLDWLFYGGGVVQFRLSNAYGTMNFNANNAGVVGSNVVSASSHTSLAVTTLALTTLRTVIVHSSTQINIAGGIEGFDLGVFNPFAIRFVPKLPKTNLNKMTLTYDISFSRI